ncbi:MAG: tRNA-specific 2-thiouridylase MnmA [Candidatus Magasanikbacteria bacterium GW2011_GWA2_45_39]|uniref:tRNA-specific 2-thiouridylase MnmA n=1 Tax=Candidatus Magasanikbacteria bacterium GW2011_GWA2_45_39 TaxID=1619041 RepID=A0A0G1QFS9_9BACT|nr:MAG: tRNA-specific 2-thiouridylase MnmA [Candidatus Magasanikbacteria bacterium GW2011_GWA2_45_39]
MLQEDSTKQVKAIRYIETKVRRFFKVKSAPGHGIEHAERVARYARMIAQKEHESTWLCEAQGWLHDVGRTSEYFNNPKKKTHHDLSFELLQEWFIKDKKLAGFFTYHEREELLYNIRYHWNDGANKYKSALVLRDADKLDLLGQDGIKRHFESPTVLDDTQRCIWFLINVLRGERLGTRIARKIAKENKLYDPFLVWIKNHLPKRRRVLCALSGGVDSAVSAYILKRAGFDVTGVYMKNWSDKAGIKGECRWQDERRDAMRVAAHIGIPFITLDFEKEYRARVVSYLFKEYKKGRTPNPDVLCNNVIKFPLLLKEARKRGMDYVATGHYARIIHEERKKHFYLQQAIDPNKDQTYFLHRLKEKELSHVLFPLNLIWKDEVRVIAQRAKLPVAGKEESMGICFIGEVPIKKFLQQTIKQKHGDIVDTSGCVVGSHDGLYWYTEGQRHGLGIGGGAPYFVVHKDMKRNKLVVARGENNQSLFSDKAYLEDVHWINTSPKNPHSCSMRLRHRQPLFEGTVRALNAREKKNAPRGATNVAIFKQKQRAVTLGQFAVFYDGARCLGGAVIAGVPPLGYTI